MNDFKKDYYIQNTIWERKWDRGKVPRFSIRTPQDKIVFHYNMMYSMFKITSGGGREKTLALVVSAINNCLRFYQRIKQLYPYNEVFIILQMDKMPQTYMKVAQIFADFIPNFAVGYSDNMESLDELNQPGYYHVVYGNPSKYADRFKKSSGLHLWSLNMGKLFAFVRF